jgi:hypothetical protein
MKDEFKELTKKLNSKLVETTVNFIKENVKEDKEIYLNDFLNLILSSHISSIYNNLLHLTEMFEAPQEPIDILMNKILFSIEDFDLIEYKGDKH